MTTWPLDSRECVFLGRAAATLPADELWSKLLSGEIAARVYCVGRTDYWPIPISPLAFLDADRGDILQRFQIDVREDDRRRPARIRSRIPVPHWIYLVRSTLPKPGPTPVKRGAPTQYDWEEIKLFAWKMLDERGYYWLVENQMDGWRSRADLIELIKDHLEKRKEPIPSDSQLKAKVKTFVDAWRSKVGISG